MAKRPCIGCIYFEACGDTNRTMPCDGRVTKSEKKKVKYYHMIIEPISGWDESPKNRREYISRRQGAAPDGWKCVGVCAFHEKERKPNEKILRHRNKRNYY